MFVILTSRYKLRDFSRDNFYIKTVAWFSFEMGEFNLPIRMEKTYKRQALVG